MEKDQPLNEAPLNTAREESLLEPMPSLAVSAHELIIRVAYSETDGQRRVHHANYLNYFEQGRVEMLRAAGVSYREFEASGLMLVVTELNVRYLGAAQFDDLLTLITTVTEVRSVRIRHRYELLRDSQMIVQGESTIACIDTAGRPAKLPRHWRRLRPAG